MMRCREKLKLDKRKLFTHVGYTRVTVAVLVNFIV